MQESVHASVFVLLILICILVYTMMFVNVYYDGKHNDIACILTSLTPFGALPYICMHDICV